MRPEVPAPRLCALMAVAALSGCTLGGPRPAPEQPPAVDRTALQDVVLGGYFETLQRLIQGAAAEQAEILSAARRDYETAPTPSHELRYALVLSTPDHPGNDPMRALQLLRELAATPETLLPAERALALLELHTVERELALAAENQRLQAANDSRDREHQLASSRRLQAEVDENARLRKELDEARAKLSAVTNIERSLNKPKPPTETTPQ